MTSKILTKNCNSCEFREIDENGVARCTKGKSKKYKVIKPGKGWIKDCKIKEKK